MIGFNHLLFFSFYFLLLLFFQKTITINKQHDDSPPTAVYICDSFFLNINVNFFFFVYASIILSARMKIYSLCFNDNSFFNVQQYSQIVTSSGQQK